MSAEYVINCMVDTMRTFLPAELARIRTEMTLTVDELPDPVAYHRQERPIESINDCPALLFAVQRLTKLDRLQISSKASNPDPVVTLAFAGGAIYEAYYECRITVVVRGEQWDETSDRRDRFVDAAHRVLIGNGGLRSGGACTLPATTITHAYYVAPDPSRWRTYREGGLTFTVQCIEAERLPGVGYVDGLKIGVVPIVVDIATPLP